MRKKRSKCQYVKRRDKKRCRNDAEPGTEYCVWHKNVDEKKLDRIKVNKGSDLKEAYLKGANLGDAILQEVDLPGANLEGANLSHANLRESWLSDANLQGANLSFASLQEVVSANANLRGADLSFASLQKAILSHANLQDASLVHANLEGAHLLDADLGGADLVSANLGGAILLDAKLDGADLTTANLRDTRLNGASLRDVVLTGCRLDGSTLWVAKSIKVKKNGRALRGVAADYRILKNYFREEGYYEEVSGYFYKERVYMRKALGKERRVLPWIKNIFYELLCGYGEKPLRTVGFSFLFIFLYFLIFSILGVSVDQALLSSLLSFATLGFSAYMMESTPLQLLAASEALLGIFMMALLAFTFARKVER